MVRESLTQAVWIAFSFVHFLAWVKISWSSTIKAEVVNVVNQLDEVLLMWSKQLNYFSISEYQIDLNSSWSGTQLSNFKWVDIDEVAHSHHFNFLPVACISPNYRDRIISLVVDYLCALVCKEHCVEGPDQQLRKTDRHPCSRCRFKNDNNNIGDQQHQWI